MRCYVNTIYVYSGIHVLTLHKNTAMSGQDSRTNESYTVMKLIFIENTLEVFHVNLQYA